MPLVSAQELAGIRAFGLKALTDSCDILRKWEGTDGGYQRGGFQTIAAGVACRIMQETQRDSKGMAADREAGRTFWKLAVPVETDLRDGDKVQIGGLRYDVLQVFAINTDRVFIEAQLARIEGAE